MFVQGATELYVFPTAAGPIMRCRGWDLAGTPCTLIKACQDEAVKFKDKNNNRTEDGDLATGSGGSCAGPRTGLETSTLPGQYSGSQNPTLSNDWTAQMQVLMSNPELAQEPLSGSSFTNNSNTFNTSSSSQRHPTWSRGRCSITPARTTSPLGGS